MNRFSYVVAAATVVSVCAVAGAAPTYSIVTDPSPVTATPNGTVSVNIFLEEDFTGDTSTIGAENGLFTLVADVTRTAGAATITGGTGNFDPNGEFGASPASAFSFTATTADIDNGVFFPAAAFGSVTGDIRLIRFATLEFTAPSSGTSTFELINIGLDTGAGSTLADLAPGLTSHSFDVAVVIPEPGVAVLMIIGLALIAYRPNHTSP